MKAERQPTAPPEPPPSPKTQPGAVGCSLQRMVRRLLVRRDEWNRLAETATHAETKARCSGFASGVEWAASDVTFDWPDEVDDVRAVWLKKCESLAADSVRLGLRVKELEKAIANIHRWTGSKRVAKECNRVLKKDENSACNTQR